MNSIKKFNEEFESLINEANDIIVYKNKLNEAMSNAYRDALYHQYGLIQVYKNSIDAIINKRSAQQLSKREKAEVLKLLNDWADRLAKFMDEDHQKINDKQEYTDYMKFCVQLRGDIETSIRDIQNSKSTYKTDINKIFGTIWGTLKNILGTKLPQSVLKAIINSNPLTKLIADNFDIVKASYTGVKNVVKGVADAFK